MQNALTIDVEDYYSILARDWLGFEAGPTDAVVRNTDKVLELLAGGGTKATFFVLGEVAEEFPRLVRTIADAGHEVGIHGYYHHQLFKLSREEFGREVADAKKLVEDQLSGPVEGHRAPAFSIGPDTRWGLEVLAEIGFRYDSSIYPVSGRRYGWPDFPEDIHEMRLPNGMTLIEAPLSVVRLLGKRLPACGGGYLRHFPYAYTNWALGRIQRVRPAVVYIHPYDIDTEPSPADFQERLASGTGEARKFHGGQIRNRRTVAAKLSRLLRRFEFAPLGDVITSTLRPGPR